jgi:hypothetical protein
MAVVQRAPRASAADDSFATASAAAAAAAAAADFQSEFHLEGCPKMLLTCSEDGDVTITSIAEPRASLLLSTMASNASRTDVTMLPALSAACATIPP